MADHTPRPSFDARDFEGFTEELSTMDMIKTLFYRMKRLENDMEKMRKERENDEVGTALRKEIEQLKKENNELKMKLRANEVKAEKVETVMEEVETVKSKWATGEREITELRQIMEQQKQENIQASTKEKESLERNVVDILRKKEKIVRDTVEKSRCIIIFGDVENEQKVRQEREKECTDRAKEILN